MLNIPEQYRGLYKKAMSGKSRTAGVKANCLECCCWQRSEARNCQITTCPLYPYNPYRLNALKREDSSNRPL